MAEVLQKNVSLVNVYRFSFSSSLSNIFFSTQQRVHPLIPFAIMAINAIICGVLCLTLPETTDKSLPDTVRQVAEPQSTSSGGKEENEADHDEKPELAPMKILETQA